MAHKMFLGKCKQIFCDIFSSKINQRITKETSTKIKILSSKLEGNKRDQCEIIPSLLDAHTDPIKIDMDEMMNPSYVEANFYENLNEEKISQPIKRSGIYHSNGIKIYIPETNLMAGTCRHEIDELPENVPDDIRVIYYK